PGLELMHQLQQGVEGGPVTIAGQGHAKALKHFRFPQVQICHQQQPPLRIPNRPLGQELQPMAAPQEGAAARIGHQASMGHQEFVGGRPMAVR
ncbi:MAG: hypothetical protein ACK55I_41020, partial [bacterium]